MSEWVWPAAALVFLALSAVLAVLLFRRSRQGRKRAPGPLAFSIGRLHERGARPSQQDSFAVTPPELEEEGAFCSCWQTASAAWQTGTRPARRP